MAGITLLSMIPDAACDNISKKSDLSQVSYFFDKQDVLTYLTRPVQNGLRKRKVELDLSASVFQGYDNNAFLDPRREKDGYLETSFSSDMTYRYTEDIRLTTDFDVFDTQYYNYTDNNLLDLSGDVGYEVDFLDDYLTLKTDYLFDWVWFPLDENGSYYVNRVSVFAENNLLKQFSQEWGFRYEHRNYTDRKTYGPNSLKTSDLQEDNRYTGEYQFSFRPWRIVRLRQNLQFYRNDSNNQYFDYYDYWAFRTRTSISLTMTKKLHAMGSFTYTRKKYDDRLSTADDVHQKDDLYLGYVSLMYDITPSFTAALSWSYRENLSTEPLEKYSGSLFSAGVYYYF